MNGHDDDYDTAFDPTYEEWLRDQDDDGGHGDD